MTGYCSYFNYLQSLVRLDDAPLEAAIPLPTRAADRRAGPNVRISFPVVRKE